MDNNYLSGSPFEPVNTTKPVRRIFSYAGFIGLSFILMSQVSSYVLTLSFMLIPSLSVKSSLFTVCLSVGQYLFALPVVILISLIYDKNKPTKRKINAAYIPLALIICVFIAAVGAYIGNYISAIISMITGINISDPLQSNMAQMNVFENILVVAICAPIFEELIFRKLPLDRIRKYGDGPAVFVSALVFGLVHCNIYQFFYVFGIGLLLGYFYVKTGKIIYTIIIHSVFNFFCGVVPEFISSLGAEYKDPITALTSGDIAAISETVYNILYYALFFAGLVLFCVLFKKIKKDFSVYSRALGSVFPQTVFNAGVIILFIASLAMIILNVILS